jgi:hypothetical protein
MKPGRVVAWIELCLAVVLTCASAVSAWDVFFTPRDPRWRGYEEVAWIAFLLWTSLAASLWICSTALFRGWRQRWVLHLLPVVAVIAACSSPWWLRYAV